MEITTGVSKSYHAESVAEQQEAYGEPEVTHRIQVYRVL